MYFDAKTPKISKFLHPGLKKKQKNNGMLCLKKNVVVVVVKFPTKTHCFSSKIVVMTLLEDENNFLILEKITNLNLNLRRITRYGKNQMHILYLTKCLQSVYLEN